MDPDLALQEPAAAAGTVDPAGWPEGFLVSCLFGALIILVFSYNQLNRPVTTGEEAEANLYRFVVPRNFAQFSAFVRAYLVYLLLLEGIFVALSMALVKGGVAAALVDALTGGAAEAIGRASGASGAPEAVPLGVALTMIGLGPSIPGLQRVEEAFRRAAHNLAGIPGNVMEIAQSIRAFDVDPHLLTAVELRTARAAGRILPAETRVAGFEDIDDIRPALERILLFRKWSRESVDWPDSATRRKFFPFRRTVAQAADAFLMSASTLVAEAGPQGLGQDRVATLRAGAEETLKDLSYLLALYAVHAEAPTVSSRALRAVIRRAQAQRHRPMLDAMLLAVLGVTAGIFVFALLLQARTMDMSSDRAFADALGVAFAYLAGALSIYLPASLTAWAIHTGRARRNRWSATTGAVPPMRQMLWVAVACYGVALASYALQFVLLHASTSADPRMAVLNVIQGGLKWPLLAWPLLGALQGVMLCLWLDRADGRAPWRERLTAAAVQGTAFLAVASIGMIATFGADWWQNHNWPLTGAVGAMLGFLQVWLLGRARATAVQDTAPDPATAAVVKALPSILPRPAPPRREAGA